MGKRPEIWIKPLPDWRLMTEGRLLPMGIDVGQQTPCPGALDRQIRARSPQPEDGAAWNLPLVSAAVVVVLMAGMLTVIGRQHGALQTLPHTDAQAVNTVAERLCALVESNTQVLSDQGETVRYTVSIGVATHTDKAESLARLIALADNALYQAKAEGRNRVIAGVA